LFLKFLPLYRRKVDVHGNEWRWHIQGLRDRLSVKFLEGNTGPSYVFIDALDECSECESRGKVTFLQDLLSSSFETASVKVCLSKYACQVDTIPSSTLTTVSRSRLISLSSTISRHILVRWLRLSDASPGLSLLVSEIMKKASDVFLRMVLIVKILLEARDEGKTRSPMLEIIHDLPKQLNDLITQIVKSIGIGSSGDAISIMQWITFSSRPMSTTEMRYAFKASRTPTGVVAEFHQHRQSFRNGHSSPHKLAEVKSYGLAPSLVRKRAQRLPREYNSSMGRSGISCFIIKGSRS